MASEPSLPETTPPAADRRTVSLSDWMREVANDPVHQRIAADIERRIARGEFPTEPLDADGLRAYLRRIRPS